MMNRISRAVMAASMAALSLAACEDSTGANSGKLTVMLTDAPFPFAEVSRVDMFVVRIDARTSDVNANQAADASATSGWVTIASPNSVINLLDLQGGKTTNLGTTSLSSGTYNAFRLVLDTDKSSITLKDGTVLKGNTTPGIVFPSAAQTGVKVNLDAPILIAKDSSVMILDFDVGGSFVMRGNTIKQNGLLFKPVIRAVATELTGGVSGSVKGDSANGAAIAAASVEILKAGTVLTDTVSANVVATTASDATGAFKFSFVLPGTYVVRATPPAASTYKPALLTGGLTVTSGTEVANRVIVVTK